MNLFKTEYRDRITSSVGRFKLSFTENNMLYYYIEGDGRLVYFVDDRLIDLHLGDIIFIKKGALAASVKKKPVRYARFVCIFPDSLIEYLEKNDGKIGNLISFNGAKLFRPDGELKELFFKLVKENSHKTLYGCEAIAVIVKALSFLSCMESVTVTENDGDSGELIGGILSKINENFKDLSSAAEVAAALNYSPNYISEYFKKKMGMSLHEFLINKKLSVALTKMSSGMSVTDTAYECGFSSASHFIEVFKRHYSMTPKEFLKKIVDN